MTALSIRNMNHSPRYQRELERVADTTSLAPIYYWWVERRDTGRQVSDFHRTKRATADLWKRLYQPQGKTFRLRRSKVRF